VTVATVNDELRVTKLETWFDPLEMFRQIAPEGIINKVTIDPKDPMIIEPEDMHKPNVAMEEQKSTPQEPTVKLNGDHADAALVDVKKDAPSVEDLAEEIRLANLDDTAKTDDTTTANEKLSDQGQCPVAGQAVAAKPDSEEAKATYREMHKLTPLECPFMNVE